MSVSRWETQSAASAATMDDRRARQVAEYYAPPPACERRRMPDGPSRHQSFPTQAPPQLPHNGHHGRRAQEGSPPRPYPPQYDHRENQQMQAPPVVDRNQGRGYYQQQPPTPPPAYDQRGANNYQPSPQQQQHKQYTEQRRPEPPRPNGPPAQTYEEYRQQRMPLQQQQPYPIDNQAGEDGYYDTLPPPLPVRGPAPIPMELPNPTVRQNAVLSTASSSGEEPINIDDVLLGKRWSIHVISHLYQFQRQELSDYAHELVKFLRGHAIMTYEQEFGYSVMIRFTSECVAFQVIEARDLHAEFLLEKMEQPSRAQGTNQTPELEKQDSANDHDIRQRTGSFVVYFPKSAEDASVRPIHGAPMPRRGPPNAADGKGDPKYVFLLRGNEELMAWVSSWVQRRFQCVVGLHVVRVTEENLRRVARNWVIEALEREEKIEKARARKAERLRKISAASGEDMGSGDERHPITTPPRAPLLLKYRAKAESDVVKAFTMTMPWASVRRVHALMNGGVGNALGTVPEVIDRLEHLYFGNLKKDLATMMLVGFQMEEVEVDTQGKVKFFKSTMVHSILQSFLDIFTVQQVAGPTDAVTTF